jgi:hypothetical protein
VAPVIAADALVAALEARRPYARELAAVEGMGMSDSTFEALRPFAETGLADDAALAAEWREAAASLPAAQDSGPAQDESAFGRLFESARRAVALRRADGAPAQPAAARIEAALTAGDLAAALEAWNALPEDAKAATRDWAGRLEARLAAERLAERVREQAAGRLNAAPSGS